VTRGLDPVQRLRWLLAHDGLRRPELVLGNRSDDDPVVTLTLAYEDVAKSLRVSSRTVRRMVKTGELPVVEVGGMPRVRMWDLVDYVEQLPVRDANQETTT
jgi:excisionase family DNA binding protein